MHSSQLQELWRILFDIFAVCKFPLIFYNSFQCIYTCCNVVGRFNGQHWQLRWPQGSETLAVFPSGAPTGASAVHCTASPKHRLFVKRDEKRRGFVCFSSFLCFVLYPCISFDVALLLCPQWHYRQLLSVSLGRGRGPVNQAPDFVPSPSNILPSFLD